MKAVNLPEAVYADLISVQKELTSMASKPVSLSMAVYLITTVYRAHLREACARDIFRQKLANSEIMSPEEFDRTWDKPSAESPAPKKGKRKMQKQSRQDPPNSNY